MQAARVGISVAPGVSMTETPSVADYATVRQASEVDRYTHLLRRTAASVERIPARSADLTTEA
jgi:hypothetical protein